MTADSWLEMSMQFNSSQHPMIEVDQTEDEGWTAPTLACATTYPHAATCQKYQPIAQGAQHQCHKSSCLASRPALASCSRQEGFGEVVPILRDHEARVTQEADEFVFEDEDFQDVWCTLQGRASVE